MCTIPQLVSAPLNPIPTAEHFRMTCNNSFYYSTIQSGQTANNSSCYYLILPYKVKRRRKILTSYLTEREGRTGEYWAEVVTVWN